MNVSQITQLYQHQRLASDYRTSITLVQVGGNMMIQPSIKVTGKHEIIHRDIVFECPYCNYSEVV